MHRVNAGAFTAMFEVTTPAAPTNCWPVVAPARTNADPSLRTPGRDHRRGDGLASAIKLTLQAPPAERACLFDALLTEIARRAAAPDSTMKRGCTPCRMGTDGSRVFVSGIGRSIVVDPQGRLWRARTYEDFETTYTITPRSCEIATMTPKYAEMHEYLPCRKPAGSLHDAASDRRSPGVRRGSGTPSSRSCRRSRPGPRRSWTRTAPS